MNILNLNSIEGDFMKKSEALTYGFVLIAISVIFICRGIVGDKIVQLYYFVAIILLWVLATLAVITLVISEKRYAKMSFLLEIEKKRKRKLRNLIGIIVICGIWFFYSIGGYVFFEYYYLTPIGKIPLYSQPRLLYSSILPLAFIMLGIYDYNKQGV